MSTSSGAADGLGPLAPLLSMIVEQIRPLLGLLMIHSIFGAMLIPLFVALWYFSAGKRQWTPVFSLVVFDVLLGLGIAAWNVSWILSVLLNPLAGVDRSIYIAFPLVQALGTWTVDIVLILRVLAVFPYSSTRTSIFAAIFAFPVTIKISRLVLIVICIVTYADTVEDIAFVTATVSSNNAIVHSPLLRAESACQLADHIFVAAVFLWKLRSGFSRSSQSRPIIGHSIASRLRTLFYIALGNFVFPVILNLAMLVILLGDNNINVIYVVPINLYIAIMGVVFATVWNSSYSWTHSAQAQGKSIVAPASAVTFRSKLWRNDAHELATMDTPVIGEWDSNTKPRE